MSQLLIRPQHLTAPGRVFKQICENIVSTYQETIGWEPEVQIELEEVPGTWRITIELKKKEET